MQGRSRDADIGKGHVDMAGRGSWDKLGDWDCIRTLPCTKEIPRKNLLSNTGSSTQQSEMTYTGRESKKDMSITLSVCCTTKTNAIF